MTSTPPAGWFPDPHSPGQLRYWDGRQWTEHRAPTRPGQAGRPPAPPGHFEAAGAGTAPGASESKPSPAPGQAVQTSPTSTPVAGATPWYRQAWFVATAAAALAFIIGVSAGAANTSDPTASDEYKDLAGKLDSANSDLDQAQSDLSEAQGALGDLPRREEQLKKDQEQLSQEQTELDEREEAVAQAEKDVAKREKAVGIVERQIKRNTVAGDGMYKVGAEMKPGTYKSAGKNGCYYAVLNSTDTFDIAVNSNSNGPAFATVYDGQYFQTDGCAAWVLQQ